MTKEEFIIVQEIINKHLNPKENKVFIFGSQATGKTFRSSDLDIAIDGPKISPKIYFDIQSEFEESDLPYTTDIVQFYNVSDNFKKIATKKIVPINY